MKKIVPVLLMIALLLPIVSLATVPGSPSFDESYFARKKVTNIANVIFVILLVVVVTFLLIKVALKVTSSAFRAVLIIIILGAAIGFLAWYYWPPSSSQPSITTGQLSS